jgi:hypothetical protein
VQATGRLVFDLQRGYDTTCHLCLGLLGNCKNVLVRVSINILLTHGLALSIPPGVTCVHIPWIWYRYMGTMDLAGDIEEVCVSK